MYWECRQHVLKCVCGKRREGRYRELKMRQGLFLPPLNINASGISMAAAFPLYCCRAIKHSKLTERAREERRDREGREEEGGINQREREHGGLEGGEIKCRRERRKLEDG